MPTLHRTPRILSRSCQFISDLHEIGAPHYGKWNVGIHWRICFGNIFVIRGKLINVNAVVLQFSHNFCLEFLKFRLRNGIGFSNDGHDVYFCIQLFHANKIYGFEAVACRTNEVQAYVDSGVVVRGKRSFYF